MFLPKKFLFLLLLFGATFFIACDSNNPRLRKNKKPISFKSVEGITYTEVARFMQNGLSFTEYGYHLNPDWRMRFVSSDSVALFSPVKKEFLNFPLACGLDSIINTNRTYLKMRRMSKDSLVFELLLADEDTLDVTGAKIFMKFYADNYIKNKLYTTAEVLQRYRKRDTLFVKELADKANADMTNAFAAQQPVQFTSKSPLITIEKRKTKPGVLFANSTVSDDYMNPHYDIVIKKAYADFHYSFSVYVDKNGEIYYNKPLANFTEGSYRDNYIRNSTAILNGYLKKYLRDVPGQTLGMKHASVISLHVKGIAKAHTVAAR